MPGCIHKNAAPHVPWCFHVQTPMVAVDKIRHYWLFFDKIMPTLNGKLSRHEAHNAPPPEVISW
jgi:hypothetical protein